MPEPEHGGILAARALKESGVRTIFALPGGHNLPLFEGARVEGIRLIDTRHEENAVLMAEGWALATGEVGAASVTAGPALQAFVERTGIPVTTTSAARGLLDDDHPRSLGGLVHGGIAVASSDAVLVLGSRFNANLLWGGAPLFPAEGKVVQVDVDPEHLGGERLPDVGIAGDVRLTLEALTEAWRRPSEALDPWAERAREGVRAGRRSWEDECERPAKRVHPGWLARETARFAEELGPCTTVSDGGDSVLWGIAFFKAHRPGTHMYIGSALGTLGIGVPFGIAARAARAGEPVVVFTGDGAFGLSAMELDTAARHHLPLIVVVVNNGGWGDVRHEQRAFYGEEADTGAILSTMRYDLLAEAVGGYGETVEAHEDVRPALERAANSGTVSVVNVLTDPDVMSDLMKNLAGMNVM